MTVVQPFPALPIENNRDNNNNSRLHVSSDFNVIHTVLSALQTSAH